MNFSSFFAKAEDERETSFRRLLYEVIPFTFLGGLLQGGG